jgi:hypothetical protein
MDKPLIIADNEMRERITKAVNNSINEVPAMYIADFLEKTAIELRSIAERQYNEAKRQYDESKESKTE